MNRGCFVKRGVFGQATGSSCADPQSTQKADKDGVSRKRATGGGASNAGLLAQEDPVITSTAKRRCHPNLVEEDAAAQHQANVGTKRTGKGKGKQKAVPSDEDGSSRRRAASIVESLAQEDPAITSTAQRLRHPNLMEEDADRDAQEDRLLSLLGHATSELDNTYVRSDFNWNRRMDKELLPVLWHHVIPFLIPRKFAGTSNKEAFDTTRPSPTSLHPGEAGPAAPVRGPAEMSVDDRDPESYIQSEDANTLQSNAVIETARELYQLRRPMDPAELIKRKGNSIATEKDHSRVCRDQCVALVAKRLLQASQLFASVLPVYIEHGPEWEGILGSCHYGLVMTSGIKGTTVLPLQLKVLGPVPWEKKPRWTGRPRAWHASAPETSDTAAKFQDSPILRVNDVIMADKRPRNHNNGWRPRSYTTKWYISTKLNDALQVLPKYPIDRYIECVWDPWSNHSTLLSTAMKLHDILAPVVFSAAPPYTPFSVVKVEDFTFLPQQTPLLRSVNRATQDAMAQPDDAADTAEDLDLNSCDEHSEKEAEDVETTPAISGIDDDDEDTRTLVNGRLSCKFHQACTLFPRPNSAYCEFHHRVVASIWLKWNARKRSEDSSKWTKHSTDEKNSSQDDVQFHPPTPADAATFRKIRDMVKNYTVWQIDAEFASIGGGCQQVVYNLTVREFSTNKIVVSTTIDYGAIPLQEFEDVLLAHMKRSNTFYPQVFFKAIYMRKQYRSDKTDSLSLAAVGNSLRDAGFRPETHRIISWYTTADVAIFHRALLGHSEILDTTAYSDLKVLKDVQGLNCLQPVDIARVLRKCTNLTSVRCGFVHRSIFPSIKLEMHDPENDTLAANQILEYLLTEMEKWNL